ncbi:LPS export ABC transporter permease LptG [Simplicispira suum]|uniref:LPS export ABC transporter permease LptG n=1 Tax=Simplicispira suum TaxID=2109915 RepID=A0A2S0N2Y5_9BURK|nr:LPS export ABC transporter permease LptG [Simplicispira suum]AVO42510.1 LPS export ABC transporter permease LptG [Simplicispira suum]MBW7833574.1 LPS export ABC transporter permease LptG [Simplicispira suum]
MKTIRWMVYREVLAAIVLVTLGFLALFFFFDLIDELRSVGQSPELYPVSQAVLYVLLGMPSHLYELLPITVLIGTIFVMARFAQSSEFTILRTSGLGPGRALTMLLLLGCAFVVLTFALGDYVAPASDRAAQVLKSRGLARLTSGGTGAWLKERQGEDSVAVNVRAIRSDGLMEEVRIFRFDASGRLASQTHAQTAQVAPEGDAWQLATVRSSSFVRDAAGDTVRAERSQLPQLRWPTAITSDMVSAAVLKPDRMATIDLFQYVRHLEANGQSAQRYEIEFWRKVFYPLSCLVMVVLALPFAYLHFRAGSTTGYVFGGVMAGISFFLLNNVFGFAGNLQQWSPWLTAAAPGLIYTFASLAAFGWLVLRR